jgi:hypothetical protein
MQSTNTLISDKTSEIAAKPNAKANQPVINSLNSPVIANVFKAEFSKITATSPEGRAKALLAAINKALDKAGLPRIEKVKIAHLSDSATEGELANYDRVNSTMVINDTALRAKTLTLDVAATVYHEAVHSQQAYNVARYLASYGPNGKPMTAKDIQAATGINKKIVDKAVKSVNEHKTKSPLTPEQFQMAQSIYRSQFDPTNTISYNGKVYQYSSGVYQYARDAFANVNIVQKNPGAYTREQINQVYATKDYAFKLYLALPQENEAFDVQGLVKPAIHRTQKTSSQNINRVAEATNGDSRNQIASANNTNSKTLNNTQMNSIKNNFSSANLEYSNFVADSSSKNISNEHRSDSTNVPKVLALLKDNAAEVNKQYGLDVTNDDGLHKALVQYWQENNLDPKALKDQLPNMKDSEIDNKEAMDSHNENKVSSKSTSSQKVSINPTNEAASSSEVMSDATSSQEISNDSTNEAISSQENVDDSAIDATSSQEISNDSTNEAISSQGINNDSMNEAASSQKAGNGSANKITSTMCKPPDAVLNDETSRNLPKIYEGNNIKENNAANVSKVVELLRTNRDQIKQQCGLDVLTPEGLGKAVMQYWAENNLSLNKLKDQLPFVSTLELNMVVSQVTSTINNNINTPSKDRQNVS